MMTFSHKQVLNKGRIITAERMNVFGQVVTSVGLTVTPEMMPSFRFVAFYNIPWSRREEVVSDSIWVDVEDSCAGGVRSVIDNAKDSPFLETVSVLYHPGQSAGTISHICLTRIRKTQNQKPEFRGKVRILRKKVRFFS